MNFHKGLGADSLTSGATVLRCSKAEVMVRVQTECRRPPCVGLPRERWVTAQRGSKEPGQVAREWSSGLACMKTWFPVPEKERKKWKKWGGKKKEGGGRSEKGREWERNIKRWFSWRYVKSQMRACNVGSEQEPSAQVPLCLEHTMQISLLISSDL